MDLIGNLFQEAKAAYVNNTGNFRLYVQKLPSTNRTDFEEMLARYYKSQDTAELMITHLLNICYSTGHNVFKLGGSLFCETLTNDENIDPPRSQLLSKSMKVGNTGFNNDRHMKKFSSILKTDLFFKTIHGKGGCNIYVLSSKEIRKALGRPYDDESIALDIESAKNLEAKRKGAKLTLVIDNPEEQISALQQA